LPSYPTLSWINLANAIGFGVIILPIPACTSSEFMAKKLSIQFAWVLSASALSQVLASVVSLFQPAATPNEPLIKRGFRSRAVSVRFY
jgi:hypothetical protein